MRTIRFAGIGATVGLLVFFLFWLPFLLGGVALTGLLLGGRLPALSPGQVLLWDGLAISAGVFVIRQSLRVTRVDVLADGTWRLRNALGLPVGRVPADRSRVELVEREGWNLVGTIRRIRRAFVLIRFQDRVYRSWLDLPSVIAPAYRELAKEAQ